MMKKYLLFTLAFMFLGFNSLIAQWEKCAEQPGIIEGNSPYSIAIGLAHFKTTTIISSRVNNAITIYYSNDRGKAWAKLKMPTTIPDYSVELTNRITINELGIFYIIKDSGEIIKL